MEKIVVQGGARLTGKVKIQGAKNAVLPLIAASILASWGENTLQDVPVLEDVRTICKLLESLGVSTKAKGDILTINAERLAMTEAPYDLVCKMRASFIILGPLLARKKHARIPLPGGCAIGSRPVDQHLKGLKALGAQFEIGQGFIEGFVKDRLVGATIYLDTPSVGATQNIMMAATLAIGRTVIENAACEPEIVDLANFLNRMGANIRGAGTDEIRIDGVDSLNGTEYTVIPDRIEAGTYMVAAAVTRGDVFVEGAISNHLVPLIAKLREMGVEIEEQENGIRVKAEGKLHSVAVKTLPYPGFPTDMQSQMMALQLTAHGMNSLTENVFENRFMHVGEMKRMGAQMQIEGRSVLIQGGNPLSGSCVKATDLRAGAALILAGLVAKGTTEIVDIYHIDRGYVDIVGKLSALGANVKRVPVKDGEDKRDTNVS